MKMDINVTHALNHVQMGDKVEDRMKMAIGKNRQET